MYAHALHTWMFGNSELQVISDSLKEIDFLADLSVFDSGNSTPDKVAAFFSNGSTESKVEIGVVTAQFVGHHLNLCDVNPDIRKTAIAFGKRCIDLTQLLNVDKMLVSPSEITTAHRYSTTREEDWERAIESIQILGEYAQEHNVKLMIEPINRYRVSLVHTVAEALSLAKSTGLNNIGVVADVFHMNIEEPYGVSHAIREANDKLLCIHFGGNTRNVPGGDYYNWGEVIQALFDINYKGIFSYEPVFLYFNEKEVEINATYRKDFLKEVAEGRKYIDTLVAHLSNI